MIIIVLLCETLLLQRKCEQYWPENVNENFEAPNSTIMATLTSVMPFADYEIKTFLVKDVSVHILIWICKNYF